MTKNDYIEEFLKKRGCASKEEMRDYFEFDETRLRKVADMRYGRAVLSALSSAVDAGDHIVVYGDYDADGIMASFILYSGLDRLLPGKIKIFINNRFEDGYSITKESMEKLLRLYPETGLIITCDNGIGAGEALSLAKTRGISVLVTDHHEQGTALPEGIPALDEKSLLQKEADEGSGTIREEFCGAELARRVITELYEMRGLTKDPEDRSFLLSLYAYSGFATITDSVPMNPANHYVAKRGLDVIRRDKGFFEILKRESGNENRRVDPDTIGFSYGPLFNAAGRVLGTAKNALAAPVLFYLGYEKECAQAIRSLLSVNEKRKAMCAGEDRLAFSMIEENGWGNDPFILVCGEEFSEGINGLTAAHIVTKYGVPAAVLSPVKGDPGRFKGSARSRDGFDLFRAFSSHTDCITAGGHPMAAGLSIKKEDAERVRRLLCADARGIAYKDPEPDFTLTPKTLTLSDVENMQSAFAALEPFGPGFEAPRVCIRGNVWPVRPIKEVHGKFSMTEKSRDGFYIDLIWWNHFSEADAFAKTGKELLVTGEPSVNEFNGKFSVQFKVSDIKTL